MKKRLALLISFALVVLVFAACDPDGRAGGPVINPGGGPADDAGAPQVMPALNGEGRTGDPSANLPDLNQVCGAVKEVKEGLVLITLPDNGGDYMLRFGENTVWDEGTDQSMLAEGKTITCTVKPEETFAPPAQGEVFEVISIE
jgi:hypothetical protein